MGLVAPGATHQLKSFDIQFWIFPEASKFDPEPHPRGLVEAARLEVPCFTCASSLPPSPPAVSLRRSSPTPRKETPLHRSILRLVNSFRDSTQTLTGKRPDHDSALRDLDRQIARGNLIHGYYARPGLADCGCVEHIAEALARETLGIKLVETPCPTKGRANPWELIARQKAGGELTADERLDLNELVSEILAIDRGGRFLSVTPDNIDDLELFDGWADDAGLDDRISLTPLGAALPRGFDPELLSADSGTSPFDREDSWDLGHDDSMSGSN